MMPRRQPARAEHRVRLPPVLRRGEELAALVVELAERVEHQQLLDVGEELVERRVEETDGDRQAVHRFEDALEVAALQLLELFERGVLLGFGVGEDEPLHEREAVAEEHVLGAAEADALGAELARHVRVVRQVGVGAHLHAAELVGPPEDHVERPTRLGRDDRHRADHDLTGGAVDRDDVALDERGAVHVAHATGHVDVELVRAAHRGRAHAARDDRRVAHEPAARREDALGRDHAVQVVGRRLGPHQDHGSPAS